MIIYKSSASLPLPRLGAALLSLGLCPHPGLFVDVLPADCPQLPLQLDDPAQFTDEKQSSTLTCPTNGGSLFGFA